MLAMCAPVNLLLLLFQERQELYYVHFSLASNQNISNSFRYGSSCQNYSTKECFLNLGTRVAGETSRTWDRRCDTQTPPLLFLPDGASQLCKSSEQKVSKDFTFFGCLPPTHTISLLLVILRALILIL